jgi:hypothetical protein
MSNTIASSVKEIGANDVTGSDTCPPTCGWWSSISFVMRIVLGPKNNISRFGTAVNCTFEKRTFP